LKLSEEAYDHPQSHYASGLYHQVMGQRTAESHAGFLAARAKRNERFRLRGAGLAR